MNEDTTEEIFFEITVNGNVDPKEAYEIIHNKEYVEIYKAYKRILIGQAIKKAADYLLITIERRKTNP